MILGPVTIYDKEKTNAREVYCRVIPAIVDASIFLPDIYSIPNRNANGKA